MNKLILSITTLLIITLLIITSSITYASDATLTTNTDGSKTVSRSGTSYTVQGDDLYGYYYWGWSEASYNDNGSPINGKNNFNLNPTNGINDAWSNVNGPCPTGYHVPSIEEWNGLINIWCKLYNNHCADGDVSNGIILNGNILYNNKKALGDEFLGTFNMDATHIYETDSFYWSSSSTGNDRALELRISPSSIAVQSSVRSNRDRVLCFKNEIIPNTYQNNGQIIHNEEEGTITFVYGDNSITIMDKNVGAENVGSGYDADSSSYGIKMAYSGVVEKDGLYELEEWENDPCNNIGGYIPAPLDWQSLLDMRGMIRKGGTGTHYGGYDVADVEQIATDFLMPIPLRIGRNNSIYHEIILFSNELLTPYDSFLGAIYIGDIDGAAYDGLALEAYFRCFVSENTKYKISYKSEGEIIHEEEIPAREKQADKQLVRTKNKINESNIPTPIRTGYNLTGRKTDIGEYYDFDKFVSSNITLNAEREFVGFNTTLNPNGGGGETKILTGLSEVPNNPGYQRTGYIFSGWNTESNGEGTYYTTGSTLEDNLTLYAQWMPITYSIEFTGINVLGTMINQDFTYGVAQNLTVNAFIKTGYTFSGWIYGFTGYNDQQNVINLTTTNNDIIKFTAQWTPITYIIDFSGNATNLSGTQDSINAEYDSGDLAPESSFTRIGYTFTGWNIESDGTGTGYATGDPLINLITTSGATVTLYAQWIVNIHKLSFVVDGTTIQSGDVAYATIISAPAEPKKDCNGFAGWTSSVEGLTTTGTMPDSDVTFTANWNYTCSKSSGGGGGGGGSSKTTTTNTTNTTGTVTTGSVTTGTNETNVKSDNQTNLEDKENKEDGDKGEFQKYSDEFQRAYEFAYKHGITTMPTIDQANMTGTLTRIAMAKMLSYYAINVLGQKPDTTRNIKFNDVSEKLDAEYNSGVTLAYQLGIMGINMPNNNFRPKDEVTRGEFATALSRMVYGTSDGEYKGTGKYYTNHMKKLMEEKIITNDDPNMKELRGYVMIMLMRSTETKSTEN